MFTGIVHSTQEIVAIDDRENFRRHTLQFPDELIAGLVIGASVANNGCCLTVVAIEGNRVSFDLIDETLALTNLGQLDVGSRVNIERAAKFGDEIGGHLMSGHIACVATVEQIIERDNNLELCLSLPEKWGRYVLEKGFVGVNGISLTVGKVDGRGFRLHIIPETIARTNIGQWQVGDAINIEVDPQTQAVVDTVERVLATRQ
uniref:riboflavin synthase subunit alpha n=1 Tax=Thaumasiovibrio occultus TaxID=1891184 RepID=UPI000B35DFA1|nr:riboflavin synthase subunit alpha [Thaumasiovibrio occultus]